jgi:hypothetical protein
MMNNKKLAMYSGIALLVGSISYIIYYKMSNKSNVTNSLNSIDDSNNVTASKWNINNPFSSNPANQLSASQLSIKTPAIATDFTNTFK